MHGTKQTLDSSPWITFSRFGEVHQQKTLPTCLELLYKLCLRRKLSERGTFWCLRRFPSPREAADEDSWLQEDTSTELRHGHLLHGLLAE